MIRQFTAIKRLTLSLLFFGVISSSHTGCLTDEEWESVSTSLGEWDSFSLPPQPRMSDIIVAIDSVEERDSSSLKLWFHVNYDSVLIQLRYGINYWETAGVNSFKEELSVHRDTIDFRKLKNLNYIYNLEVDSLKSNTYYGMCAFLDYLHKDDTLHISGSIWNRDCLVLQTK